MTTPALIGSYSEGSIRWPSLMSTFRRFEAVISSNISPEGLISIWSVVPGTRAELCVRTRSSQPKCAISR
jgi:hypothetical protein